LRKLNAGAGTGVAVGGMGVGTMVGGTAVAVGGGGTGVGAGVGEEHAPSVTMSKHKLISEIGFICFLPFKHLVECGSARLIQSPPRADEGHNHYHCIHRYGWRVPRSIANPAIQSAPRI